jgi:hypothetical protein
MDDADSKSTAMAAENGTQPREPIPTVNKGLFDVPLVPYVGTFQFDLKNIAELEEFASRFYYRNPGGGTAPAEGVVFREWPGNLDGNPFYMPPPLPGMHAMTSFKIINPKFKIKWQDTDEDNTASSIWRKRRESKKR